jgi:hypothetical protein
MFHATSIVDRSHAVEAKLFETDRFMVDPLCRAQRAYSYVNILFLIIQESRQNLSRTGRDGNKGSKQK